MPTTLIEVVEHSYDGVGALLHVDSLINQVVHLSGKGLTTHTKDGALPGCHEVHGAGLLRIIQVKHLLCHVETVVGRGVVLAGRFDAGGGGEKVPSLVKWLTTDAFAVSKAFWYTDLVQYRSCYQKVHTIGQGNHMTLLARASHAQARPARLHIAL